MQNTSDNKCDLNTFLSSCVFSNISSYDVFKRDFWIGYYLNKETDEWEWKESDVPGNFTYFAEGYPEFFKCSRTSVKGFWKDRQCDELLPYVCKKLSSNSFLSFLYFELFSGHTSLLGK